MSVGLGPAKGKEVPDVYNLRMGARVNDEVWFEGNSGTIHWKFEQMIAPRRRIVPAAGRSSWLGNGRRRFKN